MNKTIKKSFPHMVDSNIELYENFFTETDSDEYFQTLKQNIKWKQESMMLMGKSINFPRLTSWYGEKGLPYTFSGITLQPNDWLEMSTILDIKKQIEFESHGTVFNSVLLNKYKDGNNYIGWHSDQEKELGRDPVIASVSFGCDRIFRMRRYHDKKDVHEIALSHGSLLVMSGRTQHYWQHMIHKQKIEAMPLLPQVKYQTERINLTFRHIFK